VKTDTPLEAFRLVGGPCAGEVAEVPPEGFEVWRHVHETTTYALYERDGAVFRFAGKVLPMLQLVKHCRDSEAEVRVHADSREYER
jgi:hypothetical protein